MEDLSTMTFVDAERWADYMEWCERGYVAKHPDGTVSFISTRPSVADFFRWEAEQRGEE